MIYYGDTRESWVLRKIKELEKAPGLRRNKPIRAQAIYRAPPFDRDKQEFRTLAVPVLSSGDGCSTDALAPFLRELGR